MRISFAFLLSALFVAPAFGGPCVALDYQEMKDMPTDELTVVACEYRDHLNNASSETINDLGRSYGAAPNAMAESDRNECAGQYDRIRRVLTTKGLTAETLLQICAAKSAEKRTAVEKLLKRGR